LSYTDFWAPHDISFTVTTAHIGRNGGGKTTLLEVNARVPRPTAGCVVVRGLTSFILDLGSGINYELTGREDVFLCGATLGLSRQEMAVRFGDIVEFLGLGDFIDAPFRTNSSGMCVCLGSSVAPPVEPEILLLDEVIAVSDMEFANR
jgi:ABC-type polysaccharide/polyol phosphate transport system ATPase subunit